MKNLFYTVFLLGSAGIATAQPVLTSTNMAPIGFTAPVSAAAPGSFNPGGSGASQTWDFSSLPLLAIGDVTIVDPATTPYGATYPTSNYAYKLVLGTDTEYNFYN